MRDIYKRKAVYRRYSVISNLMIANTKSGLPARQPGRRLLSVRIAEMFVDSLPNLSFYFKCCTSGSSFMDKKAHLLQKLL